MNQEQKKKYFKKVHDNIREFGFHTTYVMEETGFTPFGYSTGIYENFKIPELFISGLPNGLTSGLIKNYAESFKFNQIPINQKIDSLTDRFSVYLINVDNEKLKEYALSSFKYYENADFKYLQLIFPDLDGYYPDEPEYNYDQKILGTFKKIK